MENLIILVATCVPLVFAILFNRKHARISAFVLILESCIFLSWILFFSNLDDADKNFMIIPALVGIIITIYNYKYNPINSAITNFLNILILLTQNSSLINFYIDIVFSRFIINYLLLQQRLRYAINFYLQELLILTIGFIAVLLDLFAKSEINALQSAPTMAFLATFLTFTIFKLYIFPFSSWSLLMTSKIHTPTLMIFFFSYYPAMLREFIKFISNMPILENFPTRHFFLIIIIIYLIFMLLFVISHAKIRRILGIIISFHVITLLFLSILQVDISFMKLYYHAIFPIVGIIVLISKYFEDSSNEHYRGIFFRNPLFTIILSILIVFVSVLSSLSIFSWKYQLIHLLSSNKNYLLSIIFFVLQIPFLIYLLLFINQFFVKGPNCAKIRLRELFPQLFYGIMLLGILIPILL